MRTFFFCILAAGLVYSGCSFSQNTNISNGYFFDGEPYLAINPVNPQHIVVAWMGYTFGTPLSIKTIVSFNRGKTWSSPVTLPHFSPSFQSADPSMVFDSAGNPIACYIDYHESPDSGGIYLVKSTDGGLTWNYLSKALDAHSDGSKIPVDRPWLTISRPENHLYITSKPAPWITPPNRPYFISSADDGLTWNSWRYIDGPGYLAGSFIKAPMAAPAVSADGAFHCMYPSWVITQNILPGYIHAKTADNGHSFTYNGACYSTSGISDTLAKAGGNLAADPADPRHLAFVFLGSSFGDLDVFCIESFDDGVGWSVPYRINTDPAGNGKMQDLAWSTFDAGGNFVVAWRDRRNGAGTGYAEASEIWGALRWKDSTNFTRNFKISDTLAEYRNVLSLNGNDFMTLSVSNDTLHAAWGDTRSGILNIWYSQTDLHSLNSTGIRNIVHEPVPVVSIFPNPGSNVFHFRGNTVTGVEVYDVNGKMVMDQLSNKPIGQVDLSDISPGVYLFLLKTDRGNLHVRIIRN